MRFTLSAVAGLTGLVLLACAIFGQPKLYIRAVRQQWNALVEPTAGDIAPPAASPPDQNGSGLAQQVAQLQQQVIQLRDQLASSQTAADQVRQQSASSPPAQAGPPAASPIQQLFVYPQQQPNPASPDRTVSQGANTIERREAPRQPPRQRTDTAVARVEPDDMQTVLTRLRQRPSPPPAQPVDSPAPAEAMRGAWSASPSPARQRLVLARAALLSGRIDDARRLLQEVQLQLVFRPIGPGDDGVPVAAQGASDVARALAALGGNDTRQSQRYIERAIDEVAGTSPSEAENSAAIQPGGYAPAYPPR